MHSPAPLIAFGWTNLPMLGWLAAAAAPLLIHLWSRRKYNEAPWAAMTFLLAAVQRQSRRLAIRHWSLLALRTLLVVLVVLAVAEPYLGGSESSLGAGQHVHRVLVCDDSYSMGYREADRSRFQRAQEMARQLVQQSSPGDAFTLVLMSSPPRVVSGKPTPDSQEIVREIDNLRPSDAAADLSAAIPAIWRIVETARRDNPQLDHHEVYFFTDLQHITWAPKLDREAAADLGRQTADLAHSASLVVIDVGQPTTDNLAITSLRTADPLPSVGRPVQLEAELRNFGRQPRHRQPVELIVDQRRIEQKEINIDPNGTASVAFSYRFDVPGDHAIEVRAPGDGLDVDNHRFLVVPVREAIRALCIDGRPSGRPFQGAADYLALALNSRAERSELSRIPVRAKVVSESALLDSDLQEFDILLLCNVAQFTAGEAQALTVFLQTGGSLVFFLGDQVLADRYNRQLCGAGQGRAGQGSANGANTLPATADRLLPRILPATLGAVVQLDQPQSALDPRGYRHPILQPFRGRGEASLMTTPVLKYCKLILPALSNAKVVLALANGDPLIVEEPIHRGRVVLVATSADASWTYMPLYPSFLPLVQEIVAWCAGNQLQLQNILVGEPFADDKKHAEQSGIHVIPLGPPLNRAETVAVNVNTAESDPTVIEAQELRRDVWPGVPLVYQTSDQVIGAAGRPGTTCDRIPIHVALLYTALGLLFIETFLGWRMYRQGFRARTHKP
jgi:hypothetical protein